VRQPVLGRQRKRVTVPCASAGDEAPCTVIVARSRTCAPGNTVRVLPTPCTLVARVGAQTPNRPMTKSFSVAVVEACAMRTDGGGAGRHAIDRRTGSEAGRPE